MTPGTYVRLRREADGLSRDDLALMIDSVPPVAHRERVALIAQAEDDITPMSQETARVLADVLSIDTDVLDALIAAQPSTPMLINQGGEA